jgi:homoserine dehydrogenase
MIFQEKIQVAILGLGTVGLGVYRLLTQNITFSSRIEVKKILVKDLNKQRDFNKHHLLTDDFEEVIQDSDIKIIFESIGGTHDAYVFVKRALENKKHVITSNKALIDYDTKALLSLAKAHDVYLLFEASVVAGVPIISNLSDIISLEDITQIEGILNGSVNSVLTRVFDNHMNIKEAILEAQSFGFLEHDPSDDLDGFDALRKLSILSKIAYQKCIEPYNIDRYGLSTLSDSLINYLKSKNLTLKQIAKSVHVNNQLLLIVEPVIIPKHNPYAFILNEDNIINLKTSIRKNLSFSGKGAGRYPTAQGMLLDLHLLLQNKAYRYTYQDSIFLEPYDEEVVFLIQTNQKELIKPYIAYEDQGFIITKKVSRKFIKTYQDTFIFIARFDLL